MLGGSRVQPSPTTMRGGGTAGDGGYGEKPSPLNLRLGFAVKGATARSKRLAAQRLRSKVAAAGQPPTPPLEAAAPAPALQLPQDEEQAELDSASASGAGPEDGAVGSPQTTPSQHAPSDARSDADAQLGAAAPT